jgi:hypothetical protein
MAETVLLDYSYARPSTSELRKFGAVGVLRYLTRSSSAKRLTAAEVSVLRHDGFWVGVVFEDGAARATEGTRAGKDDAVFAAGQATALGLPPDCPVFFAVDSDVDPVRVLPYFRGIDDIGLGRPVGVYGSQRVVDSVMSAGLAEYGWQTVAWSHGKRSRLAHLLQTTDPSLPGTDKNVLLKPLPLWGAPKPDPVIPPAPPAAPIVEDTEMVIVIDTNGTAALLAAGRILPLHTNAEVDAYRAAGVQTRHVSNAQLDIMSENSKLLS